MQKILGLVVSLLLCAGCDGVNASTANYAPVDGPACAAAQRAQYSDAQWASMSALERGIAGMQAAEACTP
jgi:hypothetical protein